MKTRLLKNASTEMVTLSANKAHGFAVTHSLVCYRTDTVYTFIPKNACSTLRLSLAMANGCVAEPNDWTWIHPNNGTFVATLRDLATARFTFVVLRCPHARLASVFLDKIVSLTQEFWALHRLENDQPDPDTLTFRQFVRLIGKRKRVRANIHWCPQTDFLVYETYDAYYALEDFGAAVRDIETRAGFDVVDARDISRHGTDRYQVVTGNCFADTPLHEIRAMRRKGRLPAHSALYDTSLKRRVADIYSSDLKFYRDQFGADNLTFPRSD